jgi:hypothetical protein
MFAVVKSRDHFETSPAEKGAIFLDGRFPRWEHKVNPEILNVAHAALCPLGQLYGTSESGCHALGIGNYRDFLIDNGFAATSIGGYEGNVAAMNTAWRDEIQRRR